MKILLVAADARGKNLVFVSDTLRAYSLEEAVELARNGTLDNIYAIKGGSGVYLRTKPNTSKNEQLERLSISSYRLFSSLDNINYALTTPAFSNYWLAYQRSLQEQGKSFIVIEGRSRIAKETARKKLQPHRNIIFAAAKKFSVDPYLLGAIIIDEIARAAPIEEIKDRLIGYFIGVNTSAGIAQVKTKTARGLIRSGYYNPNPDDGKLSPERVQKTPLSYLYLYVKEPKHSISFAAARMRAFIDEWERFVDLNKQPDIITTLYSLPHVNPHPHPKPNDRGTQIATEFYELAREWFHKS